MEGHWTFAIDLSTLEKEHRRKRELSEQRRAEEYRRFEELNQDISKYGVVEVFRRMSEEGIGRKLTPSPTPRIAVMNDTTTDQQEGTPRTSPVPAAEALPSPPGIPPPSAMSEICLQSGGADQIVNFNPESTVGSMGAGSAEEESVRQDETGGSGDWSQASGTSPPLGDAPQLVITQQPRAITSVPAGCGFGASGGKSSTSVTEVKETRTPTDTPSREEEPSAETKAVGLTPDERKWLKLTNARVQARQPSLKMVIEVPPPRGPGDCCKHNDGDE